MNYHGKVGQVILETFEVDPKYDVACAITYKGQKLLLSAKGFEDLQDCLTDYLILQIITGDKKLSLSTEHDQHVKDYAAHEVARFEDRARKIDYILAMLPPHDRHVKEWLASLDYWDKTSM